MGLLQPAFYVDHAGIAAHPADQALRVLTRRRAVVFEDALMALNISGREKVGMHVDLYRKSPRLIAMIGAFFDIQPLKTSK
jgi:hypothetical protein